MHIPNDNYNRFTDVVGHTELSFLCECCKQRISCVHTQVLEVGHGCNGAVTALIYYKGLLYSGFADGLMKVV